MIRMPTFSRYVPVRNCNGAPVEVLRFIPIHSSAPPSPGERMEAEARPGASANPSVSA